MEQQEGQGRTGKKGKARPGMSMSFFHRHISKDLLHSRPDHMLQQKEMRGAVAGHRQGWENNISKRKKYKQIELDIDEVLK
jgi:hypothetical protein